MAEKKMAEPNLAARQQEADFLYRYVTLAIEAEQIIGTAEATDRVRAGLDRLKAMADQMAGA